MDQPIRGYGSIGLILVSVGFFVAALLVEPIAAQGLVALFGLGLLLRGVSEFRQS